MTSGAVQSIPSLTDNAVNSFPTPAVITTTWDVNPGQTNTVNLMAYFSTPAQALTGGTTQIPSSRVLGRMTTGLPVAFTAITQNAVGGVGTAGGSLKLFAQNISGPNKKSSRTDNLNLQIDLVGVPDPGAGHSTAARSTSAPSRSRTPGLEPSRRGTCSTFDREVCSRPD